MRTYIISNIASCIGSNPYNPPSEMFEKLWISHDKVLYNNVINTLQPTSSLHKDKKLLSSAMKSDSYKTMSKITSSRTLDTKDKVNLLSSQNTPDLSIEESDALRRFVKSKVSTSHGIKLEKTAIDLFVEQTNIPVTHDYKLYSREINNSVLIRGKIDGRFENGIIEVKNRTRKLFHNVPLYEYIQIQLYLFLLNSKHAKHIEHFNGNILVNDIFVDNTFITQILDKLCLFDTLLESIMKDSGMQYDYFNSESRDEFILNYIGNI